MKSVATAAWRSFFAHAAVGERIVRREREYFDHHHFLFIFDSTLDIFLVIE
jgi:hypothetical protein